MKLNLPSTAALLIAALVGVLWCIFPGFELRSHQDPEIQNLNRVRQLAVACEHFAREHNGRYPPSLDALAPEILEAEHLSKIGYYWDGVSKRKYDFLYFHGLSTADGSNLPLIAAPGPLAGKRIVVRADLTQDTFPEQSYGEMRNQYHAQPHGGGERPSAGAPGRRSP